MRAAPTALLTDLYQLTMAQAYFELDMHDTAVFELFARKLPPTRRFLVAGGLEQALACIEQLSFPDADLEFLARLGGFSRGFLDHLRGVRFTGAVHAMPEGTPLFADEPLLRVTAPILEAQLLESRLLNICHFQTVIASKAARCVIAARGRRLVDFGLRRAHEADAALFAARAAYLAGFDATATVEAGRCFGIPLSGTLAHSFIEAHDSEEQAFSNFLRCSPVPTTLLIDTYDTQRAVDRVIALSAQLAARGEAAHLQAVRIDSGDLAREARAARSKLDAAGFPHIQIVASGGLDEWGVQALAAAGVPIDAFGIGTALDASTDAPALDMAYKLEAYAGTPRRKRSSGKATWPGAKQVYRERDAADRPLRDRIVLAQESAPGEALLVPVMERGERVGPRPELAAAREYCRCEVARLPGALRALEEGPAQYPVIVSASLQALARQLDLAH